MAGFSIPPVTNRLRILMIAPQPWFQPRGTPFSVLHRIKALTLLGHEVDLATYSIGQDVPMQGLRICRAAAVPFIKKVKIGPSRAKLFLDIALYRRAVALAKKGGYDLLHTHEEAGFFGVNIARRFRLPHLYDMHSSLPQQLHNFRYSKSKLLVDLFEKLEARTIHQARAVITICPELQHYVEARFPGQTSLLIENVADNTLVFPAQAGAVQTLRDHHGLHGCRVVLYYGTLEAYQGIPLLIDSAVHVLAQSKTPVKFLLVGGTGQQVAACRTLAAAKGISKHCLFTGFVQPQAIPGFIDIADVLVSPRNSGTNSPLKIYSYLRAGRPVVATRHVTHTQILDDTVAYLAEAEAVPFARAILTALTDAEGSAQRSAAAARLAEEKYSYGDYLRRVQWIVDRAVSGAAA